MGPQQISLQGEPSSVPPARHFVERVLLAWDLDDLVWTGTLLVSELTANSCLHARTPMTVTLERTAAGGVRLEVRDGSAVVPRMRNYAEEATTGRGMRLVDELSERWGVERVAGGKCVWVELPPARAGTGLEDDDEADVDRLLERFHDDADVDPGTGRAAARGAATASWGPAA